VKGKLTSPASVRAALGKTHGEGESQKGNGTGAETDVFTE